MAARIMITVASLTLVDQIREGVVRDWQLLGTRPQVDSTYIVEVWDANAPERLQDRLVKPVFQKEATGDIIVREYQLPY